MNWPRRAGVDDSFTFTASQRQAARIRASRSMAAAGAGTCGAWTGGGGQVQRSKRAASATSAILPGRPRTATQGRDHDTISPQNFHQGQRKDSDAKAVPGFRISSDAETLPGFRISGLRALDLGVAVVSTPLSVGSMGRDLGMTVEHHLPDSHADFEF